MTPFTLSVAEIESLLKRSAGAVTRYGCYPTPERFAEQVGASDLRRALKQRCSRTVRRPLALVVNLGSAGAGGEAGSQDVEREALLYGELLGARDIASQLHVAAGDVEVLRPGTISALLEGLAQYLVTLPPREARSIDIHARAAQDDTVAELAALGFARVCVTARGTAPCEPTVVAALQAMERARRAGIANVGVELRCGASAYAAGRFAAALDGVVRARPGSVTLSPEPATRRERPQDGADRVAQLAHGIEHLSRAGYRYVGLDVFELPEAGERRSAAPYPLHERTDVLGLGVAAVSAIGDCYGQNARAPLDYASAVRGDRLPVTRGHRMTPDDLLRREVIHAIECRSALPFSALEYKYGIEFGPYFAEELARLEDMHGDGFVELYADAIELTEAGRPLARVVSALFDRYQRPHAGAPADPPRIERHGTC